MDAGFRFARRRFPRRGRGEGVCRGWPTSSPIIPLPFIIEVKATTPRWLAPPSRWSRASASIVCSSAASPTALAAVREAAPDACTSAATEIRRALYKSYVWWPPGRVAYQAFQVPEVANGGTRVVSPRFVRLARRGGRVLHVWTVNTPDDIARLKAWGVDGVITDRPDVALPFR